MKKAVVTVVCGEYYQAIANVTHRSMRPYAERIGADFITLTSWDDFSYASWTKLDVEPLFNVYDRILVLDSDVLVNPSSPNIFDIVPEHMIGAHNQAPYSQDLMAATKERMIKYGADMSNWHGTYYNSGVIVASRQHRDIFAQPPQELRKVFDDQTWINANITKNPINYNNLMNLGTEWNHMVVHEKDFQNPHVKNNPPYFKHFAGIVSAHVQSGRGNEFILLLEREIRKGTI